jgi:ribosomal protein L13E
MIEPGNETAAAAGGGGRPPECHVGREHREQVIRTLKAALVQGRLTEDEYDARMGQVSARRSHAELAALIADLPIGRMDAPVRPPTAKDVRIGVGVSVAAASVAAAVLLWHPDNRLAFMMFLIAAVTLLVAPIITVGMMVDVRRQKRSGRPLPP